MTWVKGPVNIYDLILVLYHVKQSLFLPLSLGQRKGFLRGGSCICRLVLPGFNVRQRGQVFIYFLKKGRLVSECLSTRDPHSSRDQYETPPGQRETVLVPCPNLHPARPRSGTRSTKGGLSRRGRSHDRAGPSPVPRLGS